MNTLSWLVYGAEVLSTLKGMGVGALVISAVLAFLLPLKGVEAFSYEHSPMDGLRRPITWVVAGCGAALLVFAPSKSTLYLIAASEVGETVVTSPDTIEIMSDLKAIIKKRLKEELAD